MEEVDVLMERFFKGLSVVRPVPMQDFVEVSSLVKGFLVGIAIACIQSNRFQIRLHLMGDVLIVGPDIKDIGALSYYGNKDEVSLWIQHNIPIFVNLLEKMQQVDIPSRT
jgi:hypothetical protein